MSGPFSFRRQAVSVADQELALTAVVDELRNANALLRSKIEGMQMRLGRQALRVV